jgi:hypothetical protein
MILHRGPVGLVIAAALLLYVRNTDQSGLYRAMTFGTQQVINPAVQ